MRAKVSGVEFYELDGALRVAAAIKIWKRPELTRATVRSLRVAAEFSGIDLKVVLCGSEGSASERLAEELADHYVEAPNKPLTSKANACWRACKDVDPTHLLCMGSDDVVSPDFLEPYIPHMGSAEIVGWDDCYFYERGQLWYWRGYGSRRDETIGAGRLLSRELVERMGWRASDKDDSRRLDLHQTNLRKKVWPRAREVRMRLRDKGVYLIDVKDDVSITRLSEYRSEDLEMVEDTSLVADTLALLP